MAPATDSAPILARDQLRRIVERIERMEEEKAGVATDIREIYAEAKGMGFNTKVLRQLIKLRQMDPTDRREARDLLDTYMVALGMPGD